MSGAVSNEHNDHSGIYSEAELKAREEERLNRHVNKEQPQTVVRHVPKEESGGEFIFRLVGLPGPITLAYASDGEVIFKQEGSADVSAEFPVAIKSGKTVSVVLKIPAMEFETKLQYDLREGKWVALEFTEEGLKNSQVKI